MDSSRSASMERATGYSMDTPEPVQAGVFGVQSSFSIQPGQNASELNASEGGSGLHDKFAHTRGKRKRTSREDFTILEGAYQRNSRPDKATRASIVASVSMTEKEVQIWFQNRRQMTRRKCRTWQPNEITSIIRSSQEQHEAVGSSQQSASKEDIPVAREEGVFDVSASHHHGEQPAHASSQPEKEPEMESSFNESSVATNSLPSSQALVTEVSSDAANVVPESHDVTGSARLQEGAPHVEGSTGENVPERMCEVNESNDPESRRKLKRKSSAVRLSLSFDGKAELVLGSDSPSPPKKTAFGETRPGRAGILQRSQSAINSAEQVDQPLGIDIPGWRPSRALGRSRNARTWEFYCDSDARNALTKSAEHDQKGSAQAVLGLIRSGSNARKPLTPVKKENVALQRSDSGAKLTTVSQSASRGKLARTMSSVARLQTVKHEERTIKPTKSKLGGTIEIWEDNFGDSDKENQDPDGDARYPSASRGSEILSDSLLSTEDKENNDRTFSASKPARADDELDAVQNLLRLSQGAWC